MTSRITTSSPPADAPGVRYEAMPAARSRTGTTVPGLHAVWITLDNPAQLNSYTTDMVKGVILGMRRASNDRARRRGGLHRRGQQGVLHRRQHRGVRRVLRGRPEEYRQYMRLFNDMVTAILSATSRSSAA